MNNKGITQFLIKHAGASPASFHMPGHKGKALYERFGYGEFLEKFFDCDITEIPGADNLFQTEGIILETMEKYRTLYGSRRSYLLVNGTSGGIIASILACAKGGQLVMARNCHKSVFNALTLGGIRPVYAHPSVVEGYGIAGPVEAEKIDRLLTENPHAKAVILPSPNYYGICSDIRAIAEAAHAHDAVLIVDQAHGAHLKGFESLNDGQPGRESMPLSAESSGADIVINSTHKTLASLTQSAVLNVCSDRVNLYELEDRLQQIESTSPSYILMGSLDINADIMADHGQELFSQWRKNLDWFYEEADRLGIRLMKVPGAMDDTKINLDMSAFGYDGGQLEAELNARGIFPELTTGNLLMCMTGIGNTRHDYQRLLDALADIIAKADGVSVGQQSGPASEKNAFAEGGALWTKKRALHEIPVRKRMAPIDDCAGQVCGASIIPYPPGIPLVCPGEEIGADDIEYVKALRQRGEKVMGIDDQGRIVING